MAKKVRIQLNSRGIAKWLRAQKSNPKMVAALKSEGEKLAKRAGPGFGVKEMRQRRNRPGVIVAPLTGEAMRTQARENRLGKALGGG